MTSFGAPESPAQDDVDAQDGRAAIIRPVKEKLLQRFHANAPQLARLETGNGGRGLVGMKNGDLAQAIAHAHSIEIHGAARGVRGDAERALKHNEELLVDLAFPDQDLSRQSGNLVAIAGKSRPGFIIHIGEDTGAGQRKRGHGICHHRHLRLILGFPLNQFKSMEESGPCYPETRPLETRPTVSPPEMALPPQGILGGMSEKSLQDLSCYGRFDELAKGTVLIREGEMQERFYVVVSGELSVTVCNGKRETILSSARTGECLGEVNLLEPGSATATVRVVHDSVVWSMDSVDLRVYLQDHAGGAGAFLMGMAACLSGRLRSANNSIRQHHALPAETLPLAKERAITASNAPVQPGFFDRIKKSIAGEKKIRISTKIKM